MLDRNTALVLALVLILVLALTGCDGPSELNGLEVRDGAGNRFMLDGIGGDRYRVHRIREIQPPNPEAVK